MSLQPTTIYERSVLAPEIFDFDRVGDMNRGVRARTSNVIDEHVRLGASSEHQIPALQRTAKNAVWRDDRENGRDVVIGGLVRDGDGTAIGAHGAHQAIGAQVGWQRAHLGHDRSHLRHSNSDESFSSAWPALCSSEQQMGNELTRTAMSLLRPGETERFAFSEDATSLLSRAVADAIVRPSGEEELLALLRLVVALKTDLSSPTAALAIEAVVQGSGRACALLLSNRRAWKQRTVRLLGRATNLRARHTAGSSPIGSIRLSTMIDPVSRRPMNGKRGRR